MFDKLSRQPKRRVSCDACGSAKVKCDQRHPACTRCVSHGLDCVYGISKRSKRRLRRITPNDSSLPSSTNRDHSTENVLISDRTSTDFSTPTGHMDDAVDMSVDAYGGLAGVDFPPLPSQDIYAFDTIRWDEHNEHNDIFTANSFSLYESSDDPQSLSTSTMQHSDCPSWIDPKRHDCAAEACSIWTNLSLLNHGGAVLRPRSSTLAGRTSIDVILRTNRDACEKLERLLCHRCANSPDLSMLYASIVSRILIWYQQAASCCQSITTCDDQPRMSHCVPWTLANTDSTADSSESSSHLGSTSGTASPRGNISMHTCTPDLSQSVTGGAVVFGSFQIDDQNLQALMHIHLVSSELRRVNKLIKALTSHAYGGTNRTEEFPHRTPDALRSSLSSYLREEYSQCVMIVQWKLRELDANSIQDTHEVRVGS